METTKLNYNKKTSLDLLVSRAIGISESTENKFIGLSAQHFFNDAIVFSLWSIAGLLDANWHSKS